MMYFSSCSTSFFVQRNYWSITVFSILLSASDTVVVDLNSLSQNVWFLFIWMLSLLKNPLWPLYFGGPCFLHHLSLSDGCAGEVLWVKMSSSSSSVSWAGSKDFYLKTSASLSQTWDFCTVPTFEKQGTVMSFPEFYLNVNFGINSMKTVFIFQGIWRWWDVATFW